jgi:hypothetical protein
VSSPVAELQWQYIFKITEHENVLYVFNRGTGGNNKAKCFE